MRPPTKSDSFSSRFLGQILQLRLVKYPLKLLQKASVWTGLVFPVETLRSKLCPTAQSPTRLGKLVHLLLSVTLTSIQNFLGYLLREWDQMSKEIQEALMDPAKERDDVAPKQEDPWLVFLERDLPEDDSDDLTYEPSEMESDSEEYQAQNDTDLELEELGEVTVQEALAIQGPVSLELGAEDPAMASDDAQNPSASGSSGDGSEETDTACDTSTSQDGDQVEWEHLASSFEESIEVPIRQN
ncbi:hypothetical protein HGM15179_014251 [Zosterops borbonicus]|uniref:Uncharacterized protein n=1 Tax=Zosterops borbonicus TaxID=364589 RepID=A0A8K1G6Y3_9PASS|nr:hypothetical protein HGM15179_014251 [Zosterops borbonicus]